MAEGQGPQLYSIAAHRGFADALVAGLLPRYGSSDLGLARLTLLLPSRRTQRTVTEAFIRLTGEQGGGGLLLPRMAVVGDLDLDETLGPLFDPLGSVDIPPASDPARRWLRLAEHLASVEGHEGPVGAGLLRRAFEFGRAMDRLLVEGIDPDELLSERVVGIIGELANHWRDSTRIFLQVQAYWRAELAERGEIDAPARRNRLFDYAAREWRSNPPAFPIVAAGVTSASPALARLLRVVSELPGGAVILPDLDLSLDDAVWEGLGRAGVAPEPGGAPFGRDDAITHPQYHLKLLLNRMGVARAEVRPWHRAGLAAAPPERSKAISNLFLPPAGSAQWVDLPARARRLAGVRVMASAHPGEEAQAIALLIREALETPERRVALVTPDRGLAARVSALLHRWDIAADDTAGRPLPQTPAGRVLLLIAEVIAESFAPVPLIALLIHPLVRKGEMRAKWLGKARAFELQLRGPRPAAGLDALRMIAAKADVSGWWDEVEPVLAPLAQQGASAPLAELIELLASTAEQLCGPDLWSNPDGRALSQCVEELREAASHSQTLLDPRDLHAALRDAMDRVSVRPPWGGHPRVAIYGLLEARMSRSDLVICGGMAEGVWPGNPSPDSLLPPPVLRALGVPGADFRIGLAAHDLAAALGAPEVVLSYARRDEGSPVVPSRFVLRVKAMLGEMAQRHEEHRAVRLARVLDHADRSAPYPRPKPMPDAEQRKVAISATGLDRLRSDPYQFYASSILGLRSVDALDAEPSPAWKGEAVHEILDRWHKAGDEPGTLHQIAAEVLDSMSAHPLMRSLWRPRLIAALDWIDTEIARLRGDDGRTVLQSEVWGDMEIRGIRIHGRADRIDQLPGGGLAIVDYKTGQPPSRAMVKDGYSLQLGLIGMIAERGGFKQISGQPREFEYWSLAKDTKRRDENGFGYVSSPFKTSRADGVDKEDFLVVTQNYLDEAIDRWILGGDPFTARLNPDIGGYNDFDQLMRLDEWLPLMTDDDGDEA